MDVGASLKLSYALCSSWHAERPTLQLDLVVMSKVTVRDLQDHCSATANYDVRSRDFHLSDLHLEPDGRHQDMWKWTQKEELQSMITPYLYVR